MNSLRLPFGCRFLSHDRKPGRSLHLLVKEIFIFAPANSSMEIQKKNVRSILFIDDDQDEYDLVNEAIQEIDRSISIIYVNACDQLLQYRQQTFDLILLDINMPHHDGFFILNCIRKHGYIDIPIIMYTNSLSPTHIARAYEEGANLYFVKPESFSGLLKALRKLIHLDWANPFSITKTYCQAGIYRIFNAD